MIQFTIVCDVCHGGGPSSLHIKAARDEAKARGWFILRRGNGTVGDVCKRCREELNPPSGNGSFGGPLLRGESPHVSSRPGRVLALLRERGPMLSGEIGKVVFADLPDRRRTRTNNALITLNRLKHKGLVRRDHRDRRLFALVQPERRP